MSDKENSSLDILGMFREAMQGRREFLRKEFIYIETLFHGMGLEDTAMEGERSEPLRILIFMLCPTIALNASRSQDFDDDAPDVEVMIDIQETMEGAIEEQAPLPEKAGLLLKILHEEEYTAEELEAFGSWMAKDIPEKHRDFLKRRVFELVEACEQSPVMEEHVPALLEALTLPLKDGKESQAS